MALDLKSSNSDVVPSWAREICSLLSSFFHSSNALYNDVMAWSLSLSASWILALSSNKLWSTECQYRYLLRRELTRQGGGVPRT